MITINDIKVSEDGRTIEVKDGRVYIDGKQVNVEGKAIYIYVQGGLHSISVDVCKKVLVEGDAGNVKSSVGGVEVRGLVKGSVRTMSGDVRTGDVGGDISTMSGDVKCGKVSGKVKTMSGDVTVSR